MAEDPKQSDIERLKRQNAVSSDELIKRAWSDIGRAESGERSAEKAPSASGAMTSSANVSSTASSVERTLAAEEIARLLREEEQLREPATRPTDPPRPRHAAPSDLPPPRPRRAAPLETTSRPTPPSKQFPPPPVPPQSGQQPPARGSGRRPTWLVFVAIAAVLSIFGRFAEDVSTETDDVPVTSPATTEPVSLESSTLVSEDGLEAGTCIVRLPPGANALVATVPCAEPHQYEVFAIVESAAPTAAYTDPEEVYDLGYGACFDEFVPYVDEDYANSPWFIRVIPPTESEWVEQNDRSATCLLYQPGDDGPIYSEGTARGSGGVSG